MGKYTPEQMDRIQKCLSLLCHFERGITILRVNGNDWGCFYDITFDFFNNEVRADVDGEVDTYPMYDWVELYLSSVEEEKKSPLRLK